MGPPTASFSTSWAATPLHWPLWACLWRSLHWCRACLSCLSPRGRRCCWALHGLPIAKPHWQPTPTPSPQDTAPAAPGLGDILDLDEIHVQFAPDLVPMVLDPGLGLDARISNIRAHVAREFGLILPEIRLTDES